MDLGSPQGTHLAKLKVVKVEPRYLITEEKIGHPWGSSNAGKEKIQAFCISFTDTGSRRGSLIQVRVELDEK